jgi:hypothetical protein
MGDLIFITQTGGIPGKQYSLTSREIVRAHVMRKHWREIKEQAKLINARRESISDASYSASSDCNPNLDNPPSSQLLRVLKPGRAKPARGSAVPYQNLAPRAPTRLCHEFGSISDAFVYAGSHIDSGSHGYFHHYGFEFNMMLCNQIQPVQLAGPAFCCTAAVQYHSPALLHAVCYHGAAHEAVVRANFHLRQNMFRDLNFTDRAEGDALYHKSQTLCKLRNALNSNENRQVAAETTVLCVAILLTAEATMPKDNSIENHTDALVRLVRASGGLNALSSMTASMIQLADMKAAIAQRRVPSFALQPHLLRRAQNYTRLANSSISEDFNIANFGLGFAKPSLLPQLHPALLLAVAQARHLALAVSGSTKSSRPPQMPDIDDFIALEHSLLSLRGHHSLSPLDECVRLALLLFSNSALWRIPPFFNWMTSLVNELDITLERLDWRSNVEERAELLLWISLLGRYAVRMGTEQQRRRWSERVSDVASRIEATSWKEVSCELQKKVKGVERIRARDIRQVVHTFAYVDDVYGHAWEEIWNEVILERASGDGASSAQVPRANIVPEDHPCSYGRT